MLGPDIDLSSVRRNRLNLFGDRKTATAINYRPQNREMAEFFLHFYDFETSAF